MILNYLDTITTKIKIHLSKLGLQGSECCGHGWGWRQAREEEDVGRRASRAQHVPSTAEAASWGRGVLRRPGPEVCLALGAERARSSLVVPGIVGLGLQCAAESSGSF